MLFYTAEFTSTLFDTTAGRWLARHRPAQARALLRATTAVMDTATIQRRELMI